VSFQATVPLKTLSTTGTAVRLISTVYKHVVIKAAGISKPLFALFALVHHHSVIYKHNQMLFVIGYFVTIFLTYILKFFKKNPTGLFARSKKPE